MPIDLLEEEPPQLPRIDGLLARVDAPLIQLLGWPGSGRRRLQANLLRSHGDRAAAVPCGPEGFDAAALQAARARGARWFFSSPGRGAEPADLASRLEPGERAVVSAWAAADADASLAPDPAMATIGHGELLLTRSEVETLARRAHGSGRLSKTPPEEALDRLHQWSGGWLLPCEMVLHADCLDRWWQSPGLGDFVRYRVLAGIDERQRRWLTAICLEIAAGCTRESDLRGRLPVPAAGWRRLLDASGWLLRGPEGTVTVPGPLADALIEEDQRRPRSADPAPSPIVTRPPVDSEIGDEEGDPVGDGSAVASARAATATVLPFRPRESRYRLRLFGAVELQRVNAGGAAEPLSWPFRRVIEILALLATSSDRRCRRDRILERVWPEEEEKGKRSLHPTVSHLRRALRAGEGVGEGATVELQHGVYRLLPVEGWQVDVEDFYALTEGLHEHSPLSELEQARALYRGPFMDGFRTPWIVDLRRQLAARFCRAQEVAGVHYAAQGRLQDAEDAFRRVLLEDPVHEPVHLRIMRLYARRGRPDLVRRQYQRLCQILLDELRTRPMDATAREYRRLIGWSG